MAANYTPRQGEFLAFIYYYTQFHGRPPAESDMRRYFDTTAPSVHQMVARLEERGFIAREPQKSRSIKLLLPPDQLPELGGTAPRLD